MLHRPTLFLMRRYGTDTLKYGRMEEWLRWFFITKVRRTQATPDESEEDKHRHAFICHDSIIADRVDKCKLARIISKRKEGLT